MAYPPTIATLHFQYKTAFDALKMFFHDKNDLELSLMVLDFKTQKELSKPAKVAKVADKAPDNVADKAPDNVADKAPDKAPDNVAADDAKLHDKAPAKAPKVADKVAADPKLHDKAPAKAPKAKSKIKS